MPRKVTKSLVRTLNPDRKYQSILVQRLINKSMLDGKKLTAERAVYAALEQAAKKLDSEDPLEVFEKALKNVSPNFEVKSRRVGGANYQIPFPVSGHRQLHYAFSWLVRVCHTHSVLRLRSWMHVTKLVQLSRRRKTLTRWQKQTARLHTLPAANCSLHQKTARSTLGGFLMQETLYKLLRLSV
jgi:small subunit ribosomal protein S7